MIVDGNNDVSEVSRQVSHFNRRLENKVFGRIERTRPRSPAQFSAVYPNRPRRGRQVRVAYIKTGGGGGNEGRADIVVVVRDGCRFGMRHGRTDTAEQREKALPVITLRTYGHHRMECICCGTRAARNGKLVCVIISRAVVQHTRARARVIIIMICS